jgi:hypothetical protein
MTILFTKQEAQLLYREPKLSVDYFYAVYGENTVILQKADGSLEIIADDSWVKNLAEAMKVTRQFGLMEEDLCE